jgi:hypothetical protein
MIFAGRPLWHLHAMPADPRSGRGLVIATDLGVVGVFEVERELH